MTHPSYRLYRGLEKPLIYRGFKGKFIYWGVGSFIVGLLIGGLISALTHLLLGGFATLVLMSGGLTYTWMKQRRGLYDKTRYRGICIHAVRLSVRYDADSQGSGGRLFANKRTQTDEKREEDHF